MTDRSAEPFSWESLARSLDAIEVPADDGVRVERGSDALAKAALSEIVGAAEIHRAVRLCIHGGPGAELARSVLSLLRPPHAGWECLRILREDSRPDFRRAAAHLLRAVSDASSLASFDALLDDHDPEVREAAVGCLDELILTGLVSTHEAKARIDALAARPEPELARAAKALRETLSRSIR